MLKSCISCVFVALALVALAASAEPAAQVKVVRLKIPSSDFALDPSTGVVLQLHPERPLVVVEPQLLNGDPSVPPIEKAVAGKPAAAILRKLPGEKSGFAILCNQPPVLEILDVSTLGQISSIRLRDGNYTSLAASPDPQDPFIYYMSNGATVGRVDIKRNLDEGQIENVGVSRSLTILGGGQLLMTQSDYGNNAFGLHRLNSMGRLGVSFEQVPEPLRTAPNALPVLVDRGIVIGNRLLAPDTYEQLAEFPESIAGSIPGTPFLLAFRGAELRVVSANSGKLVSKLTLPEEALALSSTLNLSDRELVMRRFDRRPNVEGPKLLGRARLLVDSERRRILLCGGEFAVIIPLELLGIPDEPLMALRLAGAPTPLIVGREQRVPIAKLDPRIKVQVTKGPPGTHVVDDAIVITPDAASPPTLALTFSLRFNEIETTQTLQIPCEYSSIVLPFDVRGLKADATGRWAVAWDTGVTVVGNRNVATRIAVLDLRQAKVAVSAHLAGQVTTIAIDEDHVYVALQDADVVMVLRRDTLASVRNLPVPFRPALMGSGGGRLYVQSGTVVFGGSDPAVAFRLDDFQPVAISASKTNYTGLGAEQGVPRIPVRGVGAWLVDGVIFDDACKQALAVTHAPGFAQCFEIARDLHLGLEKDTAVHVQWGVRLAGNGLARFGSAQRFAAMASQGIILRGFPAAACMSKRPVGNPITRATVMEIRFYDLAIGALRLTLPLCETPGLSNFDATYDKPLIVEGDGVLAVAIGKEVHLLTLPARQLAAFPRPMRFKLQPAPIRLSDGKPTTIPFEVESAVGAITYELRTNSPFLKLDPKSGLLTIDGPALLAEQARSLASRMIAPTGLSGEEKPAARLDSYLNSIASRYDFIFGRATAAVPVAAAVSVVARDSELRQAVAQRVFFLEMPRGQVTSEIEQLMKTRRPTSQPAIPITDNAEKRLAEVESRLHAMEDKLDRLMNLIEQRNGGPATRPDGR